MFNGLLSLTREAVGRVARALITLEGKTTTLQVKMKLRELGFLAAQSEVRELMLDITSNDGDLVYEQSGDRYRLYKFRIPFPATDDSTVDLDFDFKHAFDAQGICVECGVSEDAAGFFGWACDGTMTEIGQSKWKRNIQGGMIQLVNNPSVGITMFGGTNPTVTNKPQNITTNTVHRDNIPATYTVWDRNGNYERVYTNVTRAQAKQRWTEDTGRSFVEAHTTKHG